MTFILAVIAILLAIPLPARDWPEILRTRTLKVLTVDSHRAEERGLHRIIMPIDREQALLQSFARRNNLAIEYVPARSFKVLFELLKKGRGDLISANVSETPERKQKYLLSVPFAQTREIVFTAASSPIRGTVPAGLAGRTGWLLPGTSYVANFRAVAERIPGITFRELAATISHDALIENVARGRFAYSVLDECDLDAYLSYRSDIRKLFPIRHRVPLVFAASKESRQLIRRLNSFLLQTAEPESPMFPEPEIDFSAAGERRTASGAAVPAAEKPSVQLPAVRAVDLETIRNRGYLLMITTNDAFGCYLHRGQMCGFEYDLLKRFADSQKINLVTVIPKDFKDMTRYLVDGKGDVIAANFTRSPERIKAFPRLTFCAPYGEVVQTVAGRTNETISKISDLNERKFYVRKGNSYYDTLRALQKRGIRLTIVLIPEDEAPLQTLQKVASGQYDLTLMDDSFVDLAVNGGCKVKKLLPLTEKQSYSWVVRKNAPHLAAAINAFIKKEYRGTFYNILKKRYYSRQHAQVLAPYIFKNRNLTISPYDNLFRKYAMLYDFSWYFLAAQAYQESRFQPDRVNSIGAAGLMQVMPATARELGIRDLTQPENGINAGTKYMARLRDRFDGKLTPEDRLCFTLASYNAGYGHVQDARILAAQMGLDPNIWFNNTEKALSLLEFPQYASGAKYGYCRASETVPYVRNIMLQGYHYRKLLKQGHDRLSAIKQDSAAMKKK